MKAVVYKEPYKVEVEEVEDARIQDPTDVVIRITSTAICGSDLHMYEGRTGAEPGIVFGHENMGIVEEVGPGVASLSQGDCRSTSPVGSARTARTTGRASA
jgi:glutathione-independent formaldehyde dehydrogenase